MTVDEARRMMPQFNRRESDERSRQYGFNHDIFEKEDIVDVARYVMKEKLKLAWSVGDAAGNPKEAVRIFADELVEQFPVISIMLNSKLRGELELLLISELREFFRAVFTRQNCGRDLTRKQLEFQTDLIACGIAAYAMEHCNEKSFDRSEFSELLWDLLRRTYGES